MDSYNTSPISRFDTKPAVSGLDEILEEVQQLRASIARYRKLVEILIGEGEEAA